MSRVCFVISSLGGGGAEKNLAELVRNFPFEAEKHIIVITNQGMCKQNVPSNAQIHELGYTSLKYCWIGLYRKLQEIKPDCIFSFMMQVNIVVGILSYLLPKSIMVARESNIPSFEIKHLGYNFLVNTLYKVTYKRYNKIVCQSRDMMLDLQNNYLIDSDKLVIIQNPISKINLHTRHDLIYKKNIYTKRLNFICIGRLVNQKGYTRLFEILSSGIGRDYTVDIYGDGPLLAKLTGLIISLNLQNNVFLKGFVPNVLDNVSQYDFLLLTSHYEGFPNAVLEVLAEGIPVISFNIKGGINEIILDKFNGIVIEDGNSDAYNKALRNLDVSDYDGNKISTDILYRFSTTKFTDAYIVLFTELGLFNKTSK